MRYLDTVLWIQKSSDTGCKPSFRIAWRPSLVGWRTHWIRLVFSLRNPTEDEERRAPPSVFQSLKPLIPPLKPTALSGVRRRARTAADRSGIWHRHRSESTTGGLICMQEHHACIGQPSERADDRYSLTVNQTESSCCRIDCLEMSFDCQ